jgi:hypothetical protein
LNESGTEIAQEDIFDNNIAPKDMIGVSMSESLEDDAKAG